MRITGDPSRIGQAGRWLFRHIRLEDLGHPLLIVERPAQCRVDIGEVRLREMVRGCRGFVPAFRSEVRLEERSRFGLACDLSTTSG